MTKVLRLPSAASAWAAVLFLFLTAAAAQAAPTFPPAPQMWVADNANIISAPAEADLNTRLKALEDKTGRQVVVATLPSLQGQEIEDYGYQLGRAWGVGRKGRNDGALFIVAPNERKVRVEVGYGLEGILTDALSSVIIQQRVIPRFKAGDMEGGIVSGTNALIDQLSLDDGEAKQRVAAAAAVKPKGGGIGIGQILMILFVLFVLSSVFGGRRRRSAWGAAPIIFGGGGGSGWGGGGGWSGGGGGFSGGGGSFGGGGSSGSW
jgi:uncharacterized protein